ncbi:MAG: NADP-dependent malic enzyme, partial [Deltaproteobacteria bacterium]|nr:NADP-dependent malic enzyme [Deltaproteobacteria bacterium]
PGVAEPCLAIQKDPDKGWEYTARGNLVAVITNGTAVLGLGDIGPLAGKPVMEGKAGLFKKFADIDVFDLEIDEYDVDKFVDIVAALEPTFGGINLEDIKAPEAFEIERKLRERLSIPVFHDDQHGTAIIAGAGLLNAATLAGKELDELKVVSSGAGASGIAVAEFMVSLGVKRENFTIADSRGVIHDGRDNLSPEKEAFAVPAGGPTTLAEALVGADVFLGLSVGGIVSKDMIAPMADKPIIFALANPDPEIAYPDALEARPDAIMATGRSDYPNQVNNVLGFPYIFRGALDVGATTVNEEMKVAAARALADLAHEPVTGSVVSAYGGVPLIFGNDYFIPKPFDLRVLWWVAPAVAKAAMDSGVARREIDLDDYRERLRRKSGDASYSIMRNISRSAKRDPKRIVFPQANNAKLLRAIQILVDEGLAKPVLLGRKGKIAKTCEANELGALLDKVEIIDPRRSKSCGDYARTLYKIRQRKGVSLAAAESMVTKSNYFGVMMVHAGDADGLVSGLRTSYPETLRPALQVLGLRPNVKVATSMYMMVLKDSVKFFADATINIKPSAEVLADIAVQVTDAVQALGVRPRAALISFSNFGSASHFDVTKVQDALALVRKLRPDLEVDGEMQADLALDKRKLLEQYPFTTLTDEANVLIFPTLSAGNASYKVLKSLAGASAIGPLLLGIDKPVAVLQPQAEVEDIVNVTAYTVMVAQHRERQ